MNVAGLPLRLALYSAVLIVSYCHGGACSDSESDSEQE